MIDSEVNKSWLVYNQAVYSNNKSIPLFVLITDPGRNFAKLFPPSDAYSESQVHVVGVTFEIAFCECHYHESWEYKWKAWS